MATKNTKNLKGYGALPRSPSSFVVFVNFVANVTIDL